MSLQDPLLDSLGSDTIEVVHEGRTSVPGAIFNFVCTCVGAGIVSLPGSLGQAGWIGVLLIVIVAIMSNYTAKLLIECLHMVPGRRLKTYDDIGEECWGPRGRTLVGLFQNATLFGVVTIFLILIGSSMNTLISQLTLHDWVFIFGLCLLPFTWLKTMSEIASLAIFGVIASFTVALIIIIESAVQRVDGSPNYDSITDFGGFTLGFNIIVFSFGFHSVLPAIEFEMKDPSAFPLVANVSCGVIGVIYTVIATMGYLGYGSDVDSSVLDTMDSSTWYVKVAYVFITAHVTLALPLPLNPVSLAVEEAFGVNKLEGITERIRRYTIRTCLLGLAVFIASVVPYFGDFLSFVSSLTLGAVAFILPPIFHHDLCKRYEHPETPTQRVIKIIVPIVGAVAAIAGLYYSIKALYDDISGGGNPFDGYF